MPFVNSPISVVLDTNILVSAFSNGGTPARVLQSTLILPFQLCLSSFILEELKRVLIIKLEHSSSLVDNFILELQETCIIIDPAETLKLIKNKVSDNRILEVALAAEALFLVTGDRKHILPLRRIGNTQIVTPKEFLNIVENL